jgi:nucleotide-binding universal stress UspA family protein
MYDRVLVATDGSDAADAAIEEAIDLAEDQAAELHVLNVVEVQAVESMGPSPASAVDSMEEAGERVVDGAIEQAKKAGLSGVEGVTIRGLPHQEIVEYVEEHDIDIVVLGTHGRTGLDRLLLGSVAEKVVRLSAAPVLTVRSGN